MADTGKERFCISCGMPLRGTEDFWKGDTSKDYCVHCSREGGSMRSYEEALIGMSAFFQKTQGMAPQQAELAARDCMAKMPAWQNR